MATLRINLNGNITIANGSFHKFHVDRMRFIVQVCDANNWNCGKILQNKTPFRRCKRKEIGMFLLFIKRYNMRRPT